MFRKIITHKLFVVMSMLPIAANAQENKRDMIEVKKILNVIKATANIDYNYVLSVTYPNGQADHVSGEVYIDNETGLMYNSGTAFTMLYDTHWLYRADHRNKTISILNLDKYMDTAFKKDLEIGLFKNGVMSSFIDSVVVGYAGVKRLDHHHDTTVVELIFPDQMSFKNFDFVFDETNQMLISYHFLTYEPCRGNEFGKNKGTRQAMDCKGFKKMSSKKMYLADHFFSFKKGTVTLKKNKKYTLNTKL